MVETLLQSKCSTENKPMRARVDPSLVIGESCDFSTPKNAPSFQQALIAFEPPDIGVGRRPFVGFWRQHSLKGNELKEMNKSGLNLKVTPLNRGLR